MLLRTTHRLKSIPSITNASMWTRSSLHGALKPTIRHQPLQQQQQQRLMSSKPTRSIVFSPMPMAMIGLGLVCLGVGLWDHFTSDVQKYPTAVRTPLRKALYYERKDPGLALPYYQQAFEEALLPKNELALDGAPLTGILIQWGTLLDRLGRGSEARQVLVMALRHLLGMENTADKAPDQAILSHDNWTTLPAIEQKKVVGLCLKLGDINAALHRDDDAEKYYVAAVEHLLASSTVSTYDGPPLFDQAHLPAWLTSTDVGVALATLGQFYASRKRYSYAIHLYLRALNLRGMEDCESTVLMNNLAESYVAMNAFSEAKVWAEKGISLAQNPNTGKRNKDQQVCDESCGILLFNLGMIFEQMQDNTKAIQMYQQSIQHARQHEQMACVQEALKARKRVEYQVAREQQAKVE